MPIKMTVVVPVYNTGTYIEPCIASLLAQSLPSNEFEVVFVDDGSTDGTPQRLDQVASQHSHVNVIHTPNSGWPGRPRNVGIDAARGEYVYFLDHDDSLAPEALERLYDMATRNHADVVIGKIVGHGRRVPPTLFRRNYEQCTVETAPLMESMTPHKGFRREFLDQHQLRFPEGRRRLEDHVFVVEAYLRAGVVSVLSDYTCYHHIARADAGNAGFEKLDPKGYFTNLREAIDVVERLTEPGHRRDLVMRRWYRVEMLNRAGGKAFANYPEKYRRQMYDQIRVLALERFRSPAVWEALSPQYRARSALLRAGRYDDLLALAEYERDVRLTYCLQDIGWADGCLRMTLTTSVTGSDGAPVLIVAPGGARFRTPVPALDEVDTGVIPEPPLVKALLRHRETKRQHEVIGRVTPEERDDGGRAWTANLLLDPVTVAGRPLPSGIWDLFIRIEGWGAGGPLTRRVGAERSPSIAAAPAPAVLGEQGRWVIPYWTDQGNLSLDLDGLHRHGHLSAPATSVHPVRSAEGTSVARGTLAVHVDAGALKNTSMGMADQDGVEVRVPARAVMTSDGQVLEGRFPAWAPTGEVRVYLPEPAPSWRTLSLLPAAPVARSESAPRPGQDDFTS